MSSAWIRSPWGFSTQTSRTGRPVGAAGSGDRRRPPSRRRRPWPAARCRRPRGARPRRPAADPRRRCRRAGRRRARRSRSRYRAGAAASVPRTRAARAGAVRRGTTPRGTRRPGGRRRGRARAPSRHTEGRVRSASSFAKRVGGAVIGPGAGLHAPGPVVERGDLAVVVVRGRAGAARDAGRRRGRVCSRTRYRPSAEIAALGAGPRRHRRRRPCPPGGRAATCRRARPRGPGSRRRPRARRPRARCAPIAIPIDHPVGRRGNSGSAPPPSNGCAIQSAGLVAGVVAEPGDAPVGQDARPPPRRRRPSLDLTPGALGQVVGPGLPGAAPVRDEREAVGPLVGPGGEPQAGGGVAGDPVGDVGHRAGSLPRGGSRALATRAAAAATIVSTRTC